MLICGSKESINDFISVHIGEPRMTNIFVLQSGCVFRMKEGD